MPKIIAIGASQGGVHALRALVSLLPADFPLSILIVLHIGSEQSVLPSILSESGPLLATHARDKETIEAGRIYVAPHDRHMLVVDGHLELSRGPRENFVRPAVDPLFRSVAETYGAEAIGVVLTGRLNDGTSGLFEIKRRGGIAIVQSPAEAEAPSMPQSALDNVAIDFCLPLNDIATQLIRLSKEPLAFSKPETIAMPPEASQDPPMASPIAQTCPECGGAMREEVLGSLTRFRCHIGHVMTAEVLAAGQLAGLEYDIGAVLRFLNERSDLCRRIAQRHEDNGNGIVAALWRAAGEEAQRRESVIKELDQTGWHHPEESSYKKAS